MTELVIGCGFRVGSTLGYGFLEKVYENALVHELRKAGLWVEPQHPIPVWYDGVKVGDYVADLLVEGFLLIELKSAKEIDDSHKAQCLNYLKATGLRICLLINFGQKVDIKTLPPLILSAYLCPSVFICGQNQNLGASARPAPGRGEKGGSGRVTPQGR